MAHQLHIAFSAKVNGTGLIAVRTTAIYLDLRMDLFVVIAGRAILLCRRSTTKHCQSSNYVHESTGPHQR